MSTEIMPQFAEDNAYQSTPVAAPAESNAGDQPHGSAVASREKPGAQAVHEQRVLAVRDINARIDGLENRIVDLTDAFSQSQEAVKVSVSDLQQRSMQVMADVMRVSVQLEQAARHQTEMTTLVDARLSASVADLGERLDEAAAALTGQQAHLEQIQSSHEALSGLHTWLAGVTQEQGDVITALADDTRQQFQLSRTHLDGLSALYREQKLAIATLQTDYRLLETKSLSLTEQLNGLNKVVVTTISRTRKGFRMVAGTVAALAALTLGLIAWFQLYPSAVPETVKAQLAMLTAGLHQQAQSSTELSGDVTQLHTQVATLNGLVKSQHEEIAVMRAESRQMSRTVQDIRGVLGNIQQNMDSIKTDLRAVQTSVHAPAEPLSVAP